MWLFILLWMLRVNVSQATAQDNSTQMYYVKLRIDENAISNVTKLLTPFMSFTNNASLSVDIFRKTTICQNASDSSVKCRCQPKFKWSDQICDSDQKCCGTEECTFKSKKSDSMCISDSAVTVKGSIHLREENKVDCLGTDKNSDAYKTCDSETVEKVKSVYSTLRGFDKVTISKYRSGSVIADFEMSIAFPINSKDLTNKSTALYDELSATAISLETAGVVSLSTPHTRGEASPVCFNNQSNFICSAKENFNVQPVWQLTRDTNVFTIVDGTVSKVTPGTNKSTVVVRKMTELWKGNYSCTYHQQSSHITATHKATAAVDVALLPKIHSSMTPSFPNCQNKSDTVKIEVNCMIDKSDENYAVEWSSPNKNKISSYSPPPSEGPRVYKAVTFIICEQQNTPYLYCTFKNRCNQTESHKINISVITEGDRFCKSENGWEDTMADREAVRPCDDGVGQRRRKCVNGTTAQWGKEYSECVNKDLHNVLQQAESVGIGLGTLEDSAAWVISKLEAATNKSETINSFANVNASVQVFHILSGKGDLRMNSTTADDFLKSSSNILDESLRESWKEDQADQTDQEAQVNNSMAQKYLTSVEKLIKSISIKDVKQKKNMVVAAQNCSQLSNCTNEVFNVTIQLTGDNQGAVRTAGFQNLQEYLPQRDDDYKPNSIVVSAVTEKKYSRVTVKIKFNLREERPRNVKMRCVSWDLDNGRWSDDGCTWEGSNKDNECTCSHLSSFAILMSKHPMDIEGDSMITYVGLSMSILSLVLILVIELMVWNAVVKTNTLYLRHLAQINISLCLLIADICFLTSSQPRGITLIWCKTFVVLKHFCYLAMFFWMLSLSCTVLHQTVYLFHTVSKKNYLRFSLVLGYACPLLIVFITFLTNNSGAEGVYFNKDTCWLSYVGFLKGSIHTFILPVGIIVIFNIFAMVVVIMKLLSHSKDKDSSRSKEKAAAVIVVRSVILLTPVFGITWIFGFFVMYLDLTDGPLALVVNYTFILLNAFQGFFILLTCVADKLTRDALLQRLGRSSRSATTTESSTKLDPAVKK